MRAFSCPLERVLAWRRTLARFEEAKLARLHAELNATVARDAELERERQQASEAFTARPGVLGEELAALDRYQHAVVRLQARLQQSRAEWNRLIAGQTHQVTACRREARMLEKLRERRLAAWSAALVRDERHHAEEAFLARWKSAQ